MPLYDSMKLCHIMSSLWFMMSLSLSMSMSTMFVLCVQARHLNVGHRLQVSFRTKPRQTSRNKSWIVRLVERNKSTSNITHLWNLWCGHIQQVPCLVLPPLVWQRVKKLPGDGPYLTTHTGYQVRVGLMLGYPLAMKQAKRQSQAGFTFHTGLRST